MTSIKEQLMGVFTALVTPFKQDGTLDEDSLRDHIRMQLAAGVNGLVPVGTTGEAPTLSDEERDRVIGTTVELAGDNTFILAGTGANDTVKAIKWAQRAEELGADGCLVVTPYYNKPTQEGLIAYFGEIAESTRLPIVLYSVPGRCGIEIAPETAAALHRRFSNIVAIKEAGGNVDRVTRIRAECGADFLIHSGDDGLTLPFLAAGAVGVISVVSNIAPDLMISLMRAWDEGRHEDARSIHARVFELATAMFIESSPAPVKKALSIAGRMEPTVRSPLVPISSASAEYIEDVLASSMS